MPVNHYENFPVASLLLPSRLRRPIEAIYRFARTADDIADEGHASDTQRLEKLAAFNFEIYRIEQGLPPASPEFQELAEIIETWQLPLSFFRDLLDAFAQDVTQKRYADFPELLHYCRRSANPVGRLLLHLTDRVSPENNYRSDCVCTALQLINFWQDIAIDWQKNRVYLPQIDLDTFGVSEKQIASGRWSAAWAALIDFQIDRTRELMHEGIPLVHRLPGRMGWEIRLTIQGGLRILEQIRKIRGDVFNQRPVLRQTDWLLMSYRSLFM